jgi:MFS family permease
MEDREGKDKSEHNSGDERAEESATELFRLEPELQRPRRRPGLLAIFSAYLLLVGTVIGGGVLASYAGHGTAMQVIFYVSVALLLLIPIILGCYLAFSVHRRYPFLKKIALFVERHANVIVSVCAAVALGEIIRSVWRFPQNPRMYLAEILLNFVTIVFWIMMRVFRRVDRIYDLIDRMSDNMHAVVRIVDKLSERLPPSNSN